MRWCGSVTTTDVARPKRGRESVADMVRSLGLVAVIAAVTLIFVPGLFHPSKSQRFPATDYSDYVAGFHQLTGRPALTPRSLPSSWSANAAALTGTRTTAHLQIGFDVPGAQYAGLDETVGPPAGFVSLVLGVPIGSATGTVAVGGAAWQTLRSARGEYSLVHTNAGLTEVITGSATQAQLQLLAASLH